MNALSSLPDEESLWVRFWHVPVRAERLACMRILAAFALLTDLLLQTLPHFAEFYGRGGISPAGLNEATLLKSWRLSVFFFDTDNSLLLYGAFWLWVAAACALLVGWQTRWANALAWFLTHCFTQRNWYILNSGDSVLLAALFLLLLSPCGDALSIDARHRRRRGLLHGPAWVAPWSLRVVQIQLCLIYCCTGLIKLKGESWGEGPWKNWLQGTWWDGTSVHYLFNDLELTHWSYAQFPVPLWLTKVLTYQSVWWEVLFPVLMLNRWTCRLALVFGILFHAGIFQTVDIGWFSFYTLALYAVWIPDSFWARFDALQSSADSLS